MPRHRLANLAWTLIDRAVPRGEDRYRGAIAACAEVCGDIRYCVERPQGSPRCASAVQDAAPGRVCIMDQECQDSRFPWCVSRVTDLQTGETTPTGGSAYCASVSGGG